MEFCYCKERCFYYTLTTYNKNNNNLEFRIINKCDRIIETEKKKKCKYLTDKLIKQRSKARNLSANKYLSNNLLKKEVLPEDVANAFFVQSLLKKTTGNIITVDGGNIEASLR